MLDSQKILEIFFQKPVATYSAFAFWVTVSLLFFPSIRKIFFLKTPFGQVAPTGGYLNGFDALRGLAAAYVLVGHAWHWTYPIFRDAQLAIPSIGYATKAVAMFTMLSSYLIYRSLHGVNMTTHELRKYMIRRFFRIYPLYLVSIILFLICSTTYYENNYLIKSYNFVISDIYMLPALSCAPFANPATWSLYVEVLFYMVIPLFVWGVPRRYQLSFLICTFIILSIIDVNHGRMLHLWKYFALGIIVFKLPLKYPKLKESLISSILVILGVVFLCFDLAGPQFDIFHRLGLIAQREGNPFTIGLGLSFGMIMLGLPYAPRLSSLLEIMPFRVLGIISYSIFLLHPVYIMLNFPELKATHLAGTLYEIFKNQEALPTWFFFGIFIPGFIFWASLSYILIEHTFLKLGKRITLYGRLHG